MMLFLIPKAVVINSKLIFKRVAEQGGVPNGSISTRDDCVVHYVLFVRNYLTCDKPF